jgi:sulfate transport system permease protein
MAFKFKQHSVLPGFGLSLGYTVLYLSLLVLLPLSALLWRTSSLSLQEFWDIVTDPRVLASYRLTFLSSLAAAGVNVVFGVIVAWVLVRYRFPGRKLLDAMIDLPFALPTAVSGIALTALFVKSGWIGQFLYPLGIASAFSPIGITIALVFIGLPFVVRTVQPALEELDIELEEAAHSLGANRYTTWSRVIFPSIMPSVLTGFGLSFARALGEYGSVVFISGNMPFKTEITSLLIVTKLEQYDYPGATAIAVVMMLASFVILFGINMLQRWSGRRQLAGA